MASICAELVEIGVNESFWEEYVICCLVNNGKFRALAVCEDIHEVELLDDPSDPRDKIYFMVKRDVAMPEIRELPISPTRTQKSKSAVMERILEEFRVCIMNNLTDVPEELLKKLTPEEWKTAFDSILKVSKKQ